MKKIALLFSCAILVLCSCGDTKKASVPDTKDISLSLTTVRLDQELYAIDTNHIADGLQKLANKYPDFMNFYLDTVMGFGVMGHYSDTTRAIKEAIHEVLTYKDYVNLQDTINKYYPNTKELDAQLTQGFKLLKHYIPACNVPKIYYLNKLLSKETCFVVDSSTACICLDMFLGAQFPYYASVGVPEYFATHLSKDFVPVSFFGAVYERSYPLVTEERPLLDLMIQLGKEQYFLHKVLPELADSTLFAFTGNQVNWCTKNEALLYNYFIQNNLLYNKNIREIIHYVQDGPFAHGIGTATDPGHPTPGNVGSWIGYKIVCSYMEQHPETTLLQLISLKIEPSKFLSEAKYKPKK